MVYHDPEGADSRQGNLTEATGQAVAELYQVFVGHTPVNGGAPQGGADEF